jgi:hypothetical protein
VISWSQPYLAAGASVQDTITVKATSAGVALVLAVALSANPDPRPYNNFQPGHRQDNQVAGKAGRSTQERPENVRDECLTLMGVHVCGPRAPKCRMLPHR